MELFDPARDLPALQARLANDDGARVVCYCAAWCRTCDAYRPLLEALADRLPRWTFIWVDIEDSPEWLGDEDIENFPTILIQDRSGTRFWGVQLPYVEHLQRLIESAAELPVLQAGPGRIQDLAGR
jgi:thiol-disulfide isomerase/thioredoxin